jgi:hypothetical protein
MVKITNNKLIIEIDCSSYPSPLSLLAMFQEGLLNMIEVADLDASHHSNQTLEFGTVQIARLIKEMSVSADQFYLISKLIKGKEEMFNASC